MTKITQEKKDQRKETFTLTLVITFVIFLIIIATIFVAVLILSVLFETGVISNLTNSEYTIWHYLLFAFIVSIIVGSAIAAIINRIPLKSIDAVIVQISRLAGGDYSVRMNVGWPLKNNKDIKKIINSFNTMVQELQSTEMLRSDFINNFSHEFKTPISAIAGYTKLLRKGNLSEKQQDEYMAIIEEEALRLSNMATNILTLTKIENQAILTDLTTFNLSEQIRGCVLLFERNWSAKNLELYMDFDEHDITANEEMLKHIWINLIDNAIKFSQEYGTLKVEIKENDTETSVSISNNGNKIPDNIHKKIFNKFYQADESHSSQGNGIGLAIVKSVVNLHNGIINVESADNLTTFTVVLPKRV